MSPSVTSKDGTRITYDVCGQGPALIFITGAICFRKFGPVQKDAQTFAKDFTVYNYDRRGRGDSTDTAPYALEHEVEDIEALINAAGGKAVVYGHSSGAVLALEAALRLPGKVTRAVLYDASYVSSPEEKVTYAKLRQQVQNHLQENAYGRALRTFLMGIGMPKPFVYLLPLMPGYRTMRRLAPTLAYDLELTRDLPPAARAAQIQVPLHIIYGEKSPAVLHSVAQQLAKAVPQARLTQLEGQDHLVNPKPLLPLLRMS